MGIRYEDKYGVKNVPYRQFDEIKQEDKTWNIDRKKKYNFSYLKGWICICPFFMVLWKLIW
jgi:hypothetical protein